MDPYSSGEELVIKTRKPYTITKQRERWTEEEHNRFLEALKLYGRAWQRIEEHIGTKTAVQIRSHAQKFFTKLEKEAAVKGIPIGQALDIEIPPPRPKRKPSNPYPRKIRNGHPTFQVGSRDRKSGTPISFVPEARHVLDLEKEPLPEASSCTSPSSVNKSSLLASAGPGKSYNFKKFVPVLNEEVNKDETNEPCVIVEPRANKISDNYDTKQLFTENGISDSTNFTIYRRSNEKSALGKSIGLDQSENLELKSKDDVPDTQNEPGHVPAHILNGNLGVNAPNFSSQISFQESMFHKLDGVQPNLFVNRSSTTSEHHNSSTKFSINQPFLGVHPSSNPVQNQVDYQSFLHTYSTFSNLIVSSLLQNPAAHAAASFAAIFWSCSSMEVPVDHAANPGGVSVRDVNPVPSMAVIAAATVAAATAWWAAHGLLPVCAPFNTVFGNAPAPVATIPIVASQAGADNNDRREKEDVPGDETHMVEPDLLQEQHSTSKTSASSLSDSEENNGLKLSDDLTAFDIKEHAVVTEVSDLNQPKSWKQVDRSSCGSNTTSSSDVETDALEKNEKTKEESKEPAMNHSASEFINRRDKSSSCSSDSWKEVSEEGRLAFQALFSREVLPQSFSPPYDSNDRERDNFEKDEHKAGERDAGGTQLVLDKVWGNISSVEEVREKSHLTANSNTEGGMLTGVKLRARHTGFKPYKRCSVEAKESRVGSVRSLDEEKCPKRIRLGGEAGI